MMFERFTDEARALVPLAVEHAIRLGHRYVGGEHIVLALTTIKQGLVPPILSEAGASAAALRTAILDRYRRAS
jgi:ATP-dependent Clp protease ATP-binding subunit ClpA